MRHFRRKISKNSSKVFVLFTEILSKRLIYLLIGNLKTFEYSKKLFPFLLAPSFSLNDREKRCLLFQNFPIYHHSMIIIPVITVHRTTLRGSRDAENFPETIKCLVSVLNSSWTKWREREGGRRSIHRERRRRCWRVTAGVSVAWGKQNGAEISKLLDVSRVRRMEKPPIQEGIFFLPRKEKTGKNFPWTLCTFKRTLVNLEKHAAFSKAWDGSGRWFITTPLDSLTHTVMTLADAYNRPTE